MDETDLSQLTEEEVMNMYSDIIESGQNGLMAKAPYCWYNARVEAGECYFPG